MTAPGGDGLWGRGGKSEDVICRWRRALSRRSQMGYVTWTRIHRLANRWLPPARITHPHPSERLGLVT